MSHNDLKILLVSSRSPEHSAHLGGDIVNALLGNGCAVDFLSLYPSSHEHPYPVYTVLDRTPRKVKDILLGKLSNRFYGYLKKLSKPVRSMLRKGLRPLSSRKQRIGIDRKESGFFYLNENLPEVEPELLLGKIPPKQKYDLIITLFWQDMLNSTSIKALYDCFKAPVYIYSVDMAPVTGGCYYFNDCDRYKHDCGKCPCLSSTDYNDRSHQNFIVKRNNYSASRVFFLGNTWMLRQALAGGLFNADNVLKMGIIIDENSFKPGDSSAAGRKLGLPVNRDIVLLVRSAYEKRKGADIISYAMTDLWDNIPDAYRRRICLVSIGDDNLQEIFKKHRHDIPLVNLGIVDKSMLICVYRAAALFLNPSTNDAGPSMVNQSIMCGTPVVSFNLGTAVDVVENGVSGFKTDDISREGFARTLRTAVDSIVNNTFPDIRRTSREKALMHNTSQVFADRLLGHYHTLTPS